MVIPASFLGPTSLRPVLTACFPHEDVNFPPRVIILPSVEESAQPVRLGNVMT